MSTVLLFIGASLALLLIPGPAVLYIVARSASQGVRAGLVSTVGIHVGTLVHVLAAAVGLSAILVASAQAFTIIKLAGAAYLIYLGISALRQAQATRTVMDAPRPLRQLFLDGVVLNILNPKTAVFFLAFVPQFINPANGSVTVQLLTLSAIFIVLGLVTDSLFAMSAGWLGTRLQHSPTLERRKNAIAGLSYLSLGAITAYGSRP